MSSILPNDALEASACGMTLAEFRKLTDYSWDKILAYGNREFGNGPPPLPLFPMLMLHRVFDIHDDGGTRGGSAKAEFNVSAGKWFFDCHFKGDPVVPGCLELDGLLQLSGFLLGRRGVVGRGRARGHGEGFFLGEITPDAKQVIFSIQVKQIRLKPVPFVIADGSVDCDGTTVYKVSNLKVMVIPPV